MQDNATTLYSIIFRLRRLSKGQERQRTILVGLRIQELFPCKKLLSLKFALWL